jgi:preprotein translocase subunit SecG
MNSGRNQFTRILKRIAILLACLIVAAAIALMIYIRYGGDRTPIPHGVYDDFSH